MAEEIHFSKNLSAAVQEAIELMDGLAVESVTVKLGEIKLADGRDADIRILLTDCSRSTQ